ncbi:MAG: methyltransferase domain-containing protein [Chlorobiaceae bacterium]|nr:methyltransferase domain-containing protein [Chlorobiaceae bacterium]NTW11223.1 methyltransferase domain-containing protein [Chlorobiaceae bacterium]
MISAGEEKGTELLQLRRELAAEYDIDERKFSIGASTFSILSVLDSYALLDRIDPEEFVKDEQMPYWAEIWPSAIVLSSWLAEELKPEGKRVIEIGSGVGLVSVIAASCGASVLATDYSGEALRFVRYNALKNNVILDCARLDWRNVQCPERFDCLFAADVLYERVNLLPIANAIDKLLKPGGRAFIADPRRSMAEQFLGIVSENGFRVTSISSGYEGGSQPVPVNIHMLERKTECR